ncbi:hypothetical protein CHS0354_007026 [Potamilus streckersoni]|uniref:Uncharacterized protein n=1 Tax=Potamilus streckersoni TaxID=2493646 RepID=A0AAE0RWK0_9BIVA|nr:hypothetical protein CHS0354_007026 [Potamilus streckersoni]
MGRAFSLNSLLCGKVSGYDNCFRWETSGQAIIKEKGKLDCISFLGCGLPHDRRLILFQREINLITFSTSKLSIPRNGGLDTTQASILEHTDQVDLANLLKTNVNRNRESGIRLENADRLHGLDAGKPAVTILSMCDFYTFIGCCSAVMSNFGSHLLHW